MSFFRLYGPPAVGKLTAARKLAALTGFKLFHNHLSTDLVEAVFERGTPSFGRVGKSVRQLFFEEAAKADLGLTFTFVYAHPQDDPEMARMREIFERHGANVQLVQLTCDRETLMDRVGADSRRAKKPIVDAGFLSELMTNHDLLTPYPARPSLKIYTTNTPPEQSAAAIAAHLKNEGVF